MKYPNLLQEITDTLLKNDVVVTAYSSVYYQSLYAGWPTIYFDPQYIQDIEERAIFPNELFVGLPASRDISWPVAYDAETLHALIQDSLDQNSFVVKFPEQFCIELGDRFIGPSPGNADELISEFLAKDLDIL